MLRPDPVAAHAVEQVAVEAAAVAGGKHWLAGAVRSSHLTLRRGLEPYRSMIPLGDPGVARYAAAMRAAGGGVRSLRFAVTGLTLTPISVMACATPADAAPDDLAQDLTAALSAEGCGHAGRAPDIWYFNLVYFTGPVRDPHSLVEWVAARRETRVTDVLVEDIQLVRWRYIGDGMIPVVLASAMSQSPWLSGLIVSRQERTPASALSRVRGRVVTRGGWRAVAPDDLAVGALDLAGAVGINGEGPAEFVEDDVVVPPALCRRRDYADLTGETAGGELGM